MAIPFELYNRTGKKKLEKLNHFISQKHHKYMLK